MDKKDKKKKTPDEKPKQEEAERHKEESNEHGGFPDDIDFKKGLGCGG